MQLARCSRDGEYSRVRLQSDAQPAGLTLREYNVQNVAGRYVEVRAPMNVGFIPKIKESIYLLSHRLTKTSSSFCGLSFFRVKRLYC